MLRAFLFVGFGGFAGSIARYGLGLLINKYYTQTFPLATFSINMTGCLLIGILFGTVQRYDGANSTLWLVGATGFCGGFTTFSAFALENTNLLKGQMNTTALLYIVASVIVGILLCKAGIMLVNK